uniref:DDE Tnp4 domain-containing protein n=1 Tax=Gadus morhua TaxID=8049 RepID=A0A8C5AZ13_GADMO
MLSYSINIFGCLRTTSTSCLARWVISLPWQTHGFVLQLALPSDSPFAYGILPLAIPFTRLASAIVWEALRDGTLDLPPARVISGAEQRGPLPHVFVGDEAFPLMTHLLRPFPGQHHTLEKRVFNYRLSRARLVVECAFGILASRLRMYRRVIGTSPEVAEVCVRATCVLHNFLERKKLQGRRRGVTAITETGDGFRCWRWSLCLGGMALGSPSPPCTSIQAACHWPLPHSYGLPSPSPSPSDICP